MIFNGIVRKNAKTKLKTTETNIKICHSRTADSGINMSIQSEIASPKVRSEMKTSFDSLVKNFITSELAFKKRKLSSTMPMFGLKSEESKIARNPKNSSINVLSRVRQAKSHRLRTSNYYKNESAYIYNSYHPNQQILLNSFVSFSWHKTLSTCFLTNDIIIAGDSGSNLCTFTIPQDTREPACYQDINTLMLENASLAETSLGDVEFMQLATSPILQRKSYNAILTDGKSIAWDCVPEYFSTISNVQKQGITCQIFKTRDLSQPICLLGEAQHVEFSDIHENQVLLTNSSISKTDNRLGCKIYDLNNPDHPISLFEAGKFVPPKYMRNYQNATIKLTSNKATMQKNTGGNVLLSGGYLFDVRNAKKPITSTNGIWKCHKKLDLLSSHYRTTGIFHPSRPWIIREGHVFDMRFMNERHGLVKVIPAMEGQDLMASADGNLFYSSSCFVNKLLSKLESKVDVDPCYQFSVYDKNLINVGNCGMRYPCYDLSFDQRNTNFLAIEQHTASNTNEFSESAAGHEIRSWQIGRKFRGLEEQNPYNSEYFHIYTFYFCERKNLLNIFMTLMIMMWTKIFILQTFLVAQRVTMMVIGLMIGQCTKKKKMITSLNSTKTTTNILNLSLMIHTTHGRAEALVRGKVVCITYEISNFIFFIKISFFIKFLCRVFQINDRLKVFPAKWKPI